MNSRELSLQQSISLDKIFWAVEQQCARNEHWPLWTLARGQKL